ncbi:Uncharacterised protein [Legionella lansingensis]|uniref:Uncharacterized protein n=1 Tax=Legionella lansingensis TaxID=45067 RepID=A0A0W0VKI0_9GAMM|nr:hypothetical protein Llan_1782 [Legionella lansingensis]SNV46307.1 Uncharacterised protein [Legionella lansingensis]
MMNIKICLFNSISMSNEVFADKTYRGNWDAITFTSKQEKNTFFIILKPKVDFTMTILSTNY